MKFVEKQFKLLPPAPHLCQVCAWDHSTEAPHNAQTLFYQQQFYGRYGRVATWADAMAHCPPALAAQWKQILSEKGHWTEPPAGEEPIEQASRKGGMSE